MRLSRFSSVVTVPALGFLLAASASAQGSDSCSSAQAISGEGSFAFDNTSATTDGGGSGCSSSMGRDVWWLWTAPSNGGFAVDTCESEDIDTMLSVYDNQSCPPTSPISCDDDSCGLQSRVVFSASSGNQYLIRLGSYAGSAGGSGKIKIRPSAECSELTGGPDVIVGDLYQVQKFGTVGDITGYSLGTVSCNLGDTPLQWQSSNPMHPVIGQNIYRAKDGRFEQIGMSWLKHGFLALTGNVCCSCQNPGSGSLLGVGCSDPYSSSLNGSQTGLGPRSEVNAWTGDFSYPFGSQGQTGNAIYKRIQVHNDDVNPSLNSGATYYGEGQYVSPDDSAGGNQLNNVSYRRLNVGNQSGGGWNLSLTGSTQRQIPAIQVWKELHPDVTIVDLRAPGDGLFKVASRATDNGNGTWHYEYAVYNMNSHRSGQMFMVPLEAGSAPVNIGFHGIAHHSGEPYSSADWTAQVFSDRIEWSTDTFAADQDANALRWGTMFNFRFDSPTPPQNGLATLTFFRPGSPSSMTADILAPGDGSSCLMTNYCTISANSAGAGSVISGSGSTSVAANDFGLSSSANPAGQFGIFYMGENQTNTAFGNGVRCAAGNVTRFSLLQTDGSGNVATAIDNTVPPALGKIVAGSTWNWQFWFRDPQGGGANFNTSDGLSVTYCP